ncbi:methyl-accepting chemotaxis protein [Pseudodesulfovibrio senegalensis]|uniref:Methyl-accepting chemotaxis protein n=1 Tax=Pseudodesulfovibrio senegalensis TaxID=1721087 RepID=A0A6N6N7P0_9BACT|nr:methyl-accepting chemotaxis protein [Pseudodesulfovibrio senegalensis]KAB1443379.1 methyl-accepting chemotaxis protein [Pseudodesulfovibrio senegalensis]
MKRFKDWGLSSKILILFVGMAAAVLVGMVFYYLPSTTEALMKEKRQALSNTVDVAYTLIEDYAAKARSGAMSEEEAKKTAAEEVGTLRYDEKEYFWINDLVPIMIKHPMKPELDGQNLAGIKDVNNVYLFKEMAQVARNKGEGFVEYVWPKPGASEPQPKLSYVRLYKPWGWVVGSGLYIDDVRDQMNSMRLKILVPTIVLLAIIFTLVLLVVRSIVRPLRQAVDISERMSQGDLSMEVPPSNSDEAGLVLRSMNSMVDRLKQIVAEISQATENVTAGSEELASASMELSQGASTQASAVEEVSASMEEMTSSISQNASNAKTTDGIAVKASADTAQGGEAVRNTVSAMKEIAEKISIVEEIARQTNLLALNAAIEAARAGEHGKGFAVVAAEVRKLAERSGQAAAEISELSSDSMQVAEEAGGLLERIVPDINKTAELVQEIASASDDQNAGAEQVNTGIQDLNKVVQQNASASQEVASTAEELSGQAEQLQETLRFFRLDSATMSMLNRGKKAGARKPSVASPKALGAGKGAAASGKNPNPAGPAGSDSGAAGGGVDLTMDDEDFERF